MKAALFIFSYFLASAFAFTGRLSWYRAGLGACGETHRDGDAIVAMNGEQYSGTCGRCITITYNGRSVNAKIVDLCPTQFCPFGAVDASISVFQRLASLDIGLLQMQWDFTDCGGSAPAPTEVVNEPRSIENPQEVEIPEVVDIPVVVEEVTENPEVIEVETDGSNPKPLADTEGIQPSSQVERETTTAPSPTSTQRARSTTVSMVIPTTLNSTDNFNRTAVFAFMPVVFERRGCYVNDYASRLGISLGDLLKRLDARNISS